jgi:hypothetical protein
MRRRLAVFAVCAALLASAGCTIRSEREELLPWLLKKSTYRAFGSFAGNTESTYFAKYWGFWRGLDAWNVVVLDGEHVLLQGETGYSVLSHGSLRPTFLCERLTSVSLPPGPAAVDCVDPVHQQGVLTGIAWRRFDPRGRKLDEQTVRVVGSGRIFPPPALVFAYDDAAVPYFLMMNGDAAEDYRVEPRDCALVSIRNNDPPLMGPAELRWDECHHADTWTRVTGRRFHQAGMQREWPAQPGTPATLR